MKLLAGRTSDKSLSEVQSEDVTEQLAFAGHVLDWERDTQGNEYFSSLGNGVYCMSTDGSFQSIDHTVGNESLFKGRDGHVYAVQDQEETDKFFAGDCTAEDAARVIQSRVSLYLAEQQ